MVRSLLSHSGDLRASGGPRPAAPPAEPSRVRPCLWSQSHRQPQKGPPGASSDKHRRQRAQPLASLAHSRCLVSIAGKPGGDCTFGLRMQIDTASFSTVNRFPYISLNPETTNFRRGRKGGREAGGSLTDRLPGRLNLCASPPAGLRCRPRSPRVPSFRFPRWPSGLEQAGRRLVLGRSRWPSVPAGTRTGARRGHRFCCFPCPL